jgi:diamine N-acetyltransferase
VLPESGVANHVLPNRENGVVTMASEQGKALRSRGTAALYEAAATERQPKGQPESGPFVVSGHAVQMDDGTAPISLREITDANRPEVERLGVTSEQETYVAGVAESLVEAAAEPAACPWYRAVYAGDEPVGFVMLSDNIPDGHPEYLGPYYLWRLLIDARWQGRGIGKATLELVVAYLATRPNARTLLTSVVPGPTSPIGFYLRYGFTRTGKVADGENVLELRLDGR